MEMEVVELKVRLHCKAYEKAVRKSLLKINVLGYVDRKAVVKAIHKTGRKAKTWRPSSAVAARKRDEYFSPRLPKGFSCIIPRWGYQKV
ncbi:hypothetical protein J1N35_044287 [Gossypium stocksii]|uniref:HMA domain-containing protein n=1 Tax=Gossypium stocksii TaxID=47602 RepID=A0A9D3U8V3_9ROSI|nr:hypothetical protein J1N35_044287 [Gossypium stocksii]